MGLDRIRLIKEKIGVLEYAQSVLNLPVRKSGDRCASLVPGSTNPTALVVYTDWWYDFKLGMGGDVIDLCAVARHAGDKGAAIRELGGDCGDWVGYTQNVCSMIQKFHEDLRQPDRLYLYRRRIMKGTVDRLRLGFDGSRLVIPYYKNGYVAYYVTRERDGTGPKYKKAALDGMNENIPWGLHTLNPDHQRIIMEAKNADRCKDGIEDPIITDTPEIIKEGEKNGANYHEPPQNYHEGMIKTTPSVIKPVVSSDNERQWTSTVANSHLTNEEISGLKSEILVITEGVFDALSFEQEGYKVLSPMGGYFNKEALKQVINICQNSIRVFLCFDSDDSGSRFQREMSKLMFKNRVNFCCGTLPEGIKDISDYYVNGGELADLVAAAEPGIEVLGHRIPDRDEFKRFVFDAARFVDASDLAELFEHVSFPRTWLAEVKKQALRCPPEDMIAEEVVQEKRLKYFEALGFFEYVHGVWKRRGDNEIKAYVADSLGHWRTGTKLNSVLTLLKADVVSTELFNRQDVFNFRNCMLDLKTGEMKEHSETFMSSIQVDYDYEPEAWSPRWAAFLEEVTGGDEARMNLLQEIAGYVLYSDNSLQKCFFLMGDGANGKSVYLDILSAVFGDENVSSIEMSGLVEPFQRIHLLNSIVNISTETKTDVKGAESVFKQIVVGDAISGCYKNKDFLSFRPRTKLIAACNEYIRSRDTTAGFMRRICFVSFPVKFSDDPGPGELKADKGLTAKLKQNLPAIFNWAYKGYKVLLENKAFTQTQDQTEMMESFMKVTNPLVAFIEENREDLRGEIERGNLYGRYTQWCRDAGHEPQSRTKFMQSFRATARQVKLEFREKIVHGTRYFNFDPECRLIFPGAE